MIHFQGVTFVHNACWLTEICQTLPGTQSNTETLYYSTVISSAVVLTFLYMLHPSRDLPFTEGPDAQFCAHFPWSHDL